MEYIIYKKDAVQRCEGVKLLELFKTDNLPAALKYLFEYINSGVEKENLFEWEIHCKPPDDCWVIVMRGFLLDSDDYFRTIPCKW